jgi:colanic acid/amylovoran biosynthesis glycosyltransferase
MATANRSRADNTADAPRRTPVEGYRDAAIPRPPDAPGLRLAYIMSRFPRITETFILFEMIAVERRSATVDVYPLWRDPTRTMHPEARPYVARARFRRLLAWQTIDANVRCFLRSPKRYLRVLWSGLRANFGSPRYLAGFLAAFPKAVVFGTEMRRRGIQHVHAHFASHPAAAAFVIHGLFDIPYSFTAHGSDLHRDVHMLQEKVRDAAFVAAISDFNRQVILQTCGTAVSEKVVVVHCGTDTSVFQPRGEAPSSSEPLQLTCVGTLHEVKGQQYLIRACRRLLDRGWNIRVNFAGDGPDTAQLHALASQLSMRERVVFHGRCTRDEVSQLLRKTDVVVAPSVPTRDGRREGIPVALMEAMASGLPVVASRLSGIPELVDDAVNGRLVTPGDERELADAIEALLRDPERRRSMGRAARAKIERSFELNHNAQLLLETIRSSLAAGPSFACQGRSDAEVSI